MVPVDHTLPGPPVLDRASRSGVLLADFKVIQQIGRRFGDVIREEFNIETAPLCADEAGCLVGFKDADALGNSLVKATGERERRLRAKGLRASAQIKGKLRQVDRGKALDLPEQETINGSFFRDSRAIENASDATPGADGREANHSLPGSSETSTKLPRSPSSGKSHEQAAYHGSPHIFDRFSLDAIDTDERARGRGGWVRAWASERGRGSLPGPFWCPPRQVWALTP